MSVRNKLFFLVAVVQILFFSGWYYLEHSKLSNPRSQIILVKTLPVDPRDLLSGNYFTLRYEFSNLWSFKGVGKNFDAGKKVYVVLKQDGIWYVPDYVSLQKPSVRKDQVVMRGRMTINTIEFGIEKYFINEGTKTPGPQDKIEVSLIITDDLTPRIKSLLVNGFEFRQ